MLKLKPLRLSEIYLLLVQLSMMLSSIVFIEPSLSDILVIIAFFLVFLRFFENNTKLNTPALLIFIYIVANILFSFALRDAERGIFIITIRIYLALSLWLFVEIVRRFGNKGIKIIFGGYTFAAIIALVLGLAALFHFIPLDILLTAGRPKALFKDPNVFGPFMIPVALYAALNIELSKGLSRLFWLLIFIATSLGTALSFSRGAWLNYTVAFFTYLGIRFFTTPSAKTAIRQFFFYGSLVSILALAFMILFANQPEISDFFGERAALQKYDNDRFGVQEAALNDFISGNLLGIGPGQVEATYFISTHSLYVRLLIETSFLGTFSFLGFIALTLMRSFRFALKANSSEQGLFIVFTSAILGILVNSFVIDSIHWRHFWLLLALPWGNYSKTIKRGVNSCKLKH